MFRVVFWLLLISCSGLLAQGTQQDSPLEQAGQLPARQSKNPAAQDIDNGFLGRTNESIIPNRQLLEQTYDIAVDSMRYILGPGDQMLFKTWGILDGQLLTEISAEGYLILPSIGEINVSGLPLSQATGIVRDRVKKSWPDMGMSLRLIRMRKFRVYLTGQVENPGAYYLRGVDRVSDAIGLAGDPLKLGNISEVLLMRADESQQIVDLRAFLSNGDLDRNPNLRGGDIIHVPPVSQSERHVRVDGNVAYPGTHPLAEGETLWQLLVEQRSLNQATELEAIVVKRGLKRQVFNAIEDESAIRDFELESGDIVEVPTRLEQVFVLGEVLTPGAYPFLAGHSARDYSGIAGMKETARDVSALYVIRSGSGEKINGQDVIVSNGDIVVVPRKRRETIKEYVSILTPIIGLAISIIAVTRP